MKNYAEELLHEELSAAQKDVVGDTTRYEWNNGFWETFIMPAITGASEPREGSQDASQPDERPEVQPSEEEVVARRKVEHFGQVLPIEDVEKVIDMVDSITRLPCGCRYVSTGETDKRYCFGLGMDKWGILGRFPDEASSLEVLEKEEVKRIFRQYDEEGLMHSIWTNVTPYVSGLCNCDRDCRPYKGYIEMRGAPSFFRAEYVCEVDWDQCTGCKECVSQCQFGAQFYSSALSKVYIDATRCFGCGVCRAACSYDAITLVPRQEVPEVADVWLGETPR
jgi:Pyruvate/2-oxoacid:ferredoxin oxidoreductase delta subunit